MRASARQGPTGARKHDFFAALTVAIASAFCLGGCASFPTEDGKRTAVGPEFTGPWAASYADAWSNAKNNLQRGILRDGKITERENQEVQDRFVSCMAGFGATVSWEEAGGFALAPRDAGTSSDEVNDSVTKCESATTGPISPLYFQERSNPENRDIYEIMAACLVSKGLASPGYAARDYQRDFESDGFPFSTTDESFKECNIDPLRLHPKV